MQSVVAVADLISSWRRGWEVDVDVSSPYNRRPNHRKTDILFLREARHEVGQRRTEYTDSAIASKRPAKHVQETHRTIAIKRAIKIEMAHQVASFIN